MSRSAFGECTGFADLLDRHIVAEQTSDDVDDALLPEERAVIVHAVAVRRSEFATVRHCARLALARLGHRAVPIIPGPHREPQWPPGIVGSLTHCPGLRAAAVALRHQVAAVGIDAELNEPLPSGVLELVSDDDEQRHLRQLRRRCPEVAWDRLLFSAKESIFKAWFPLMRTWLDFTECELRIDPAGGSFFGRIRGAHSGGQPTAVSSFDGRWGLSGAHLITAVCQPAPTPDR